MMEPSAVQGQWSLDKTIDGTFSFTHGLLQAATSDNVQPLALISCENFGMTLPVCMETRLALEKIARPPTASYVIKFIKARIGYIAGDCTEYLSRTEGGIRFLCLAAVLSSLNTTFEAAQIVETLLIKAAARDQLRPTLPQLKALIEALKVKLELTDFCNNIMGWEIFCTQSRPENKSFGLETAMSPPKDAIEHLIQAFSKCARIGEACFVQIKCVAQYIAWSMAFTKWFMGYPAQLHIIKWPQQSYYEILVPITQSRVQILELKDVRSAGSNPVSKFLVSIVRDVKRLEDILVVSSTVDTNESSGKGTRYRGLLHAKTWATFQMLRISRSISFFDTNEDDVAQMIRFLTIVAVENFQMAIPYRNGHDAPDLRRLRPFHSSVSVLAFLDQLFDFRYETIENDVCCKFGENELRSKKGIQTSAVKTWLREVYGLISDVICLSLFSLDAASPLLPRLTEKKGETVVTKGEKLYTLDWVSATIEQTLQDALAKIGDDLMQLHPTGAAFHGPYPTFSYESLHRAALALIGWRGAEPTLICGAHGQIVFPSAFDAEVPISEGFLQFNSFRGQIILEGVSYEEVRVWQEHPYDDTNGIYSAAALDVPIDGKLRRAAETATLQWRVTVEDGYLRVATYLCGQESEGISYESQTINPWTIVYAHAASLWTSKCQHDLLHEYSSNSHVGRVLFLPQEPSGRLHGQLLRYAGPPKEGFDPKLYKAFLYTALHNPRSQLALMVHLVSSKCRPIIHEHGCIACALKHVSDISQVQFIC